MEWAGHSKATLVKKKNCVFKEKKKVVEWRMESLYKEWNTINILYGFSVLILEHISPFSYLIFQTSLKFCTLVYTSGTKLLKEYTKYLCH